MVSDQQPHKISNIIEFAEEGGNINTNHSCEPQTLHIYQARK